MRVVLQSTWAVFQCMPTWGALFWYVEELSLASEAEKDHAHTFRLEFRLTN